jgi:hypothetical protein
MNNRFVLLGHHRSGTSFINDWLAEHPNFDTINEPFSLHTFLKVTDYDRGLLSTAHDSGSDLGAVADFVDDLAHWLSSAKRGFRGFKETAFFFQYDWLRQRLGIGKTILLFRHPRAVIASLLRRELYAARWGYGDAAMIHFPDEYVRIDAGNSPTRLCALMWKMRTDFLLHISETTDSKIILLEDMILRPQETAIELMQYFGENPAESQMRFLYNSSAESNDSTYSYKRRKIDVLEKWVDVLTENDIEFIDNYLSSQISRLGYENVGH